MKLRQHVGASHDEVQGGARGHGGRLRQGGRVAAQEGPRHGGQEGRPRHEGGPRRDPGRRRTASSAAMVEVDCETEPVVGRPRLQGARRGRARGGLREEGRSGRGRAPAGRRRSRCRTAGGTVDAAVKGLVAKIGENMAVRRAAVVADGRARRHLPPLQRQARRPDRARGSAAPRSPRPTRRRSSPTSASTSRSRSPRRSRAPRSRRRWSTRNSRSTASRRSRTRRWPASRRR